MSGFKTPEEFDAWQLAWELKERIVAFTALPPAVRDAEFCKEILKAARSGPDNISEGFYLSTQPILQISSGSRAVHSAKSAINCGTHTRASI